MITRIISKAFAAATVGGFFAISAATSVSAATVNVTYQGNTAFGSPDLSRYVEITSSGYNGGVFAGPFRLQGDNGMGKFVAFCVDLAQFLKSGTTYTTSSSSGFGNTVDQGIGRLFSTAYAGISTRVQGAAFQVALWEIISDTGSAYNLSGGTFKVKQASYSQAVIDQANKYLAALTGATTGGYRLTYLKSAAGQDIVTVSQVPLPAATGMLGLGLVSLVGLRRRRKQA